MTSCNPRLSGEGYRGKADPLPQEWSIRLEQVNKENYAEDDRLLAKGSYQVFQLEPEDGGNTLYRHHPDGGQHQPVFRAVAQEPASVPG
ncbi:MAG: hypothetical protein ACLSHM_01485 [Vescimonas sp.]